LQAGFYEVYATWPTNLGSSFKAIATNAKYQINNLTPVSVNQRLAPASLDKNGLWQSLGIFTPDASRTIAVTLTDAANGTVLADGIFFVRRPSLSGQLAASALAATDATTAIASVASMRGAAVPSPTAVDAAIAGNERIENAAAWRQRLDHAALEVLTLRSMNLPESLGARAKRRANPSDTALTDYLTELNASL
jgi:hypothetical protein